MSERYYISDEDAFAFLINHSQGSGGPIMEVQTPAFEKHKVYLYITPYGQRRFFLEIEEIVPTYTKKPISHGVRMQVFERDGFKCLKCGMQKNLTVDHIYPEILGGSDDLENLQTLCRSCNSSKGSSSQKTNTSCGSLKPTDSTT